MKDYCPNCHATVDVREVGTDRGYEWWCVVCNTVTQDDDGDNDNPEED